MLQTLQKYVKIQGSDKAKVHISLQIDQKRISYIIELYVISPNPNKEEMQT